MLWRFAGFNMLILLTGLQAIPLDVYEAARIDGASRWQIFRRITLPLLRPTIALVLILMVTGSLLAFDQFFILTRGGPDNTTRHLVHGRSTARRSSASTSATRPRSRWSLLVVLRRPQRHPVRACCARRGGRAMSVTSGGRTVAYYVRRRAGRPVPVPAAVERLVVVMARRHAGDGFGSTTTPPLRLRQGLSARYMRQQRDRLAR